MILLFECRLHFRKESLCHQGKVSFVVEDGIAGKSRELKDNLLLLLLLVLLLRLSAFDSLFPLSGPNRTTNKVTKKLYPAHLNLVTVSLIICYYYHSRPHNASILRTRLHTTVNIHLIVMQ